MMMAKSYKCTTFVCTSSSKRCKTFAFSVDVKCGKFISPHCPWKALKFVSSIEGQQEHCIRTLNGLLLDHSALRFPSF